MDNLLRNTLAKVRVIGEKKCINFSMAELDEELRGASKYRNQIKSAKGFPSCRPSQVQVPENDQKIAQELSFLQEILKILIEEQEPNKKYPRVNKILDTISNSLREEAAIVESYECNKKLFRYMSNKLQKDKAEYHEKLLKCDEKIFDLENEMKEVEIENVIKCELVHKWEDARLEHTNGRFENQIKSLRERIDKANSNYDKEIRIYNEVEVFTNHEIERLQESASQWQQRYAKECSHLDEQIKQTKLRIEKTQDRIEALREICIRRDIEIQSYLTQRAQMEEARRIEKEKWDSAVRIQAWWRGTMFRNGLGPYRKKKKAPKKGGKGSTGKNK